MLQAWTPTTSACYDLSTVFVANGLAPHAYGTTVRPNYHSKSSSVRNANPNSKPHISRKPHFNSNTIFSSNSTNSNINSNNTSNTSNGTISPANGSTNSSISISTNSSANSSVASTDYIANNSHYMNAKHYSIPKTSIAMTTPKESPISVNVSGTVDEVLVTPFVIKNESSAQSPNGLSKSQMSQSVDNSNNNRSNSPLMNSFSLQKNREIRGRIRKRKEDNISDNSCAQISDNTGAPKSGTTKIVTFSGAHNEPFELKANSFPPLPTSANICSNDEKESDECVSNQCSSLADVVKGTVKQKNDRIETKCWSDCINSSPNGSKNESNGSSDSSKTSCGTTSVHNVTNPLFCQKLSKDVKINCSKTDVNSNTEDKCCSHNSEEVIEKKTNSNSKVSQTSHDSDHCHSKAIPAITPNPCPLETSSSCLGSDISESKEKSNTMSTPIVLNGINDSFSINSDSFDENNSHSSASATQTQPSSPNSVPKNPFETNSHECNGNDDQSNDETSLLDESSDSGHCEHGVKRLTYAEIALRSAKDKLNQNSESNNSVSKDKDKESNNLSTPLKGSTHLTASCGRPKLSESQTYDLI